MKRKLKERKELIKITIYVDLVARQCLWNDNKMKTL